MRIYIGADHRGVQFKEKIKKILSRYKVEIVDVGIFEDSKMHDYPKIAYKVAKSVVKSKNNRGILVCMTGLGQMIAANKIKGVYAAVCYNAETAKMSRRHNNTNILVLGADFTKSSEVPKIIRAWLKEKFEGGRHLRRTKQIKKIEKGLAVK